MGNIHGHGFVRDASVGYAGVEKETVIDGFLIHLILIMVLFRQGNLGDQRALRRLRILRVGNHARPAGGLLHGFRSVIALFAVRIILPVIGRIRHIYLSRAFHASHEKSCSAHEGSYRSFVSSPHDHASRTSCSGSSSGSLRDSII